MSFTNFLRHLDAELLDEYKLEKFGSQWTARKDDTAELERIAATAQAPKSPPDWTAGLLPVAGLDPDHEAVRLLERREIPRDRWSELYHCPDFKEWGSRIDPEKFERMRREERLIIPVVSGEHLVGFQGRSYSDSGIRYITTRISDDHPFLYGLDRVDRARDVVAVEGPIDSMFIDNAVASCGGVITSELERAGLSRSTIVAYDNEPRNPHTVEKISRAISRGYRVFIWPESVHEKDINDWFRSIEPRDGALEVIMRTIGERSFSGLEAELELSYWRKC